MEIRIEFVNRDNSHSWVRIPHRFNKLVTYLNDEEYDDNEQETSAEAYLLLQADQKLKQNQEDLPLFAHLQELHHKCRIVAGGQNSSREKQTVFFTGVNPIGKDHKDPYELALTKPRLVSYKQKKWKRHQDTVYWVDI